MAKQTNALDSIKSDFLAALADDEAQTYQEVVAFGTRLQNEAGMDVSSSAHTLTGWAVEAGFFSGEDSDPSADKAEGDAKRILESA